MSKKSQSFKHYSTIIEFSLKIFKLAPTDECLSDKTTIASLAKAIEMEARALWQLNKEVLEGSEFDDLDATE